MNFIKAALFTCSLMATSAMAQPSQQTSPSIPSATLARDINGFQLGMSITDIRSQMTIEHLANETFVGLRDGIQYEFGFTPRGRLFRVRSIQPIGRFAPDAAFVRSLSDRLAQKYGRPVENGLPRGPVSWELIQPVTDASGQSRPFRTMWFTAILSSDGSGDDGISLDLTMIDFRVLWADQQELNRLPSQQASGAVRF